MDERDADRAEKDSDRGSEVPIFGLAFGLRFGLRLGLATFIELELDLREVDLDFEEAFFLDFDLTLRSSRGARSFYILFRLRVAVRVVAPAFICLILLCTLWFDKN